MKQLVGKAREGSLESLLPSLPLRKIKCYAQTDVRRWAPRLQVAGKQTGGWEEWVVKTNGTNTYIRRQVDGTEGVNGKFFRVTSNVGTIKAVVETCLPGPPAGSAVGPKSRARMCINTCLGGARVLFPQREMSILRRIGSPRELIAYRRAGLYLLGWRAGPVWVDRPGLPCEAGTRGR